MTYSPRALEALLFPLHRRVHDAIARAIARAEALEPGYAATLERIHRALQPRASTEPIEPSALRGFGPPPGLDVHVFLDAREASAVRKVGEAAVYLIHHSEYGGAPDHWPGCHIRLSVQTDGAVATFLLPVAYATKPFEPIALAKGRYQLYRHSLYPQGETTPVPRAGPRGIVATAEASGYAYIGITRRSWQERWREHRQAVGSGSALLFHRALADQLFPVASSEHEVLKIGLSEDEALDLEEREVEARTLHPIHARGLNMIPGGRAGLRFIAQFRKPGETRRLDPEHAEAEAVAAVQALLAEARGGGGGGGGAGGGGGGAGGPGRGAALAALWRENEAFRIAAMTNSPRRLSFAQIIYARIWHASGWALEKIHEHVRALDTRAVSLGQVRALLAGRTYSSINPMARPGIG